MSLSLWLIYALLILVTATLIILGGINFIFIADLFKVRCLFKLALDSKLILWTTILLLGVGTVVMLLAQSTGSTAFTDLSVSDKVLGAFFHSVMTRTAGFTTIQTSNLAPDALVITMFLMFIGGASGSTAGGIKVSTFAMIMATIYSSLIGTVGLSTGITPFLSTVGKIIITITMFIGRLSPLTLARALLQHQQPHSYRYPEENIRIG